MSESTEPVLLSENSGLDINENMSFTQSQNCSFTSVEPLVDTSSSSIFPKSDSTFIENCNSLTSETSIKVSETSSEIPLIFNEVPIKNDVNASNQNTDFNIHDSENNIFESEIQKLNDDELNFNENCIMISDFNNEENTAELKEEEFHDAVQFFKDPLSLAILENAGSSSSVPTNSSIARSSLYQKFDPLHAKFFSQSNTKSNELQEIAEDEIEPNHCNVESALESDTIQNEVETDKLQGDSNNVLIEVTSDEHKNDIPHDDNNIHLNESTPEIVNKHLINASPRQSLGNILISFDSPVFNKDMDSHVVHEPQKMYSEEEFQQALKIQELTIQENFLKKQQELETKISQQKSLSNSLYAVLNEAINLTFALSDEKKQMCDKLEVSEKEVSKLKEDLKTSMEDIQSVETTFADFHKRYEQCKNMLKVYTENEKCLRQQLEHMSVQLNEKEEMYKALQSRTQDMLDKANIEVANAKKAGDAQVAVLNAQLKKAELKISSLESDVKHVKIENGKLSSICDDLMAKVSEA